MGETSKDLLESISIEKCWAISAHILNGFLILSGSKILPSVLGMSEGIISPVWGWEKWSEINLKVMAELGKRHFLFVKEKFNIKIENAQDAAKLLFVGTRLAFGPGFEGEIAEATPERAFLRWIKCPLDKWFTILEVDPQLRAACHGGHQAWGDGIKAVNPKITHKLTMAMPRGDPYCESVIEFKKE